MDPGFLTEGHRQYYFSMSLTPLKIVVLRFDAHRRSRHCRPSGLLSVWWNQAVSVAKAAGVRHDGPSY